VNIRLLAIDLDGTLISGDGEISARNRAAIDAARRAGVRVVVCTGRGLVECRRYLSVIDQRDPVAVAGGSIIADPASGRTLRRFPVRLDLVHRTVERLVGLGHPALVLKDPAEAGYDYLVVHGESRLPLDPVTEWWFGRMGVAVRFAEHAHQDQHPEHTVRVGACGLSSVLTSLRDDLVRASGGDAHVHSFPAVVAPEHASRLPSGESLHILELFDVSATKWSAVSRLAMQWGIQPAQVAAIGDEINDVSMIRGAGVGIAMGNAVPEVLRQARYRTARNDEDGVAAAIDHLLTGRWS
jgi:5-amino-6-(5-phospho-D-ribitylamino)uracil phosphatase